MPAKHILSLFVALTTCLSLAGPAAAQEHDFFISSSRQLLDHVAPGEFDSLYNQTKAFLTDGPGAPLARYRPGSDPQQPDRIEFGHDLPRYRREYTLATLVIPKPDRPSFEQYMTVLTALSLANEKAHFDQDHNRSLDDFFAYQNAGDHRRACALYGLQQHVSDIAMFDMALKLQDYFVRRNSVFGQNAVLASLDRMNLLPFYAEFRTIAAARDRAAMTRLLSRLKAARSYINMSSLKTCLPKGEARLPPSVVARAVAPAYPYLQPPYTSRFGFLND